MYQRSMKFLRNGSMSAVQKGRFVRVSIDYCPILERVPNQPGLVIESTYLAHAPLKNGAA